MKSFLFPFVRSFWKIMCFACALSCFGCVSSDNTEDPKTPKPGKQVDYYLYTDAQLSTIQYIGQGGSLLTIYTDPNTSAPLTMSYRTRLKSEDDFVVYWDQEALPKQMTIGTYDIFFLNITGSCFDAFITDIRQEHPIFLEKMPFPSEQVKTRGSNFIGFVSQLNLMLAQKVSEANIRDRLNNNATLLNNYTSSGAIIESVVDLSNISYDLINIAMTDNILGRILAVASLITDLHKLWLDSAAIREELIQNLVAQVKQYLYNIELHTSERVESMEFTSAICSFGLGYYGELAFTDGILGIAYSPVDQYPMFTSIPGTYAQYVEPGMTVYLTRNYDLKLQNLLPNTTYFYRAFFAYKFGDYLAPVYSNEVRTFKTLGAKTGSCILKDGALTLQGEVRYDTNKNYNLLDYGFCYSKTNVDPKVGEDEVVLAKFQGSGSIEAILENIQPIENKLYYRAFLVTDGEYSYGETKSYDLLADLSSIVGFWKTVKCTQFIEDEEFEIDDYKFITLQLYSNYTFSTDCYAYESVEEPRKEVTYKGKYEIDTSFYPPLLYLRYQFDNEDYGSWYTGMLGIQKINDTSMILDGEYDWYHGGRYHFAYHGGRYYFTK